MAELGTMSSREFTEWVAFLRVRGPIGDRRADLRMGIMLASYFNSKQNKQHLTPVDFMPFESDEEEESDERMSPEEQLAYVRKLNALFGGREVKAAAL